MREFMIVPIVGIFIATFLIVTKDYHYKAMNDQAHNLKEMMKTNCLKNQTSYQQYKKDYKEGDRIIEEHFNFNCNNGLVISYKKYKVNNIK
jgi:purine-cytosine permease-like protein